MPSYVNGERKMPSNVNGDRKMPSNLNGDRKMPSNVNGDRKMPSNVNGDRKMPSNVNGDRIKSSYVKGDRIKLIGGRHEGKMAWFDVGKSGKWSDTRVYIVVTDKEKGERGTWTAPVNLSVHHQSAEEPAENYANAIIQQKPKLDRLINKVTSELAKFDLDDEDMDNFANYFFYKLKVAVNLKKTLDVKY
jgi:hypothetical protein